MIAWMSCAVSATFSGALIVCGWMRNGWLWRAERLRSWKPFTGLTWIASWPSWTVCWRLEDKPTSMGLCRFRYTLVFPLPSPLLLALLSHAAAAYSLEPPLVVERKGLIWADRTLAPQAADLPPLSSHPRLSIGSGCRWRRRRGDWTFNDAKPLDSSGQLQGVLSGGSERR